LILAPRRLHSQKPDETRERIEALVRGPYLEMFARDRRAGWDRWGSEIESGIGARRWASNSYPQPADAQPSWAAIVFSGIMIVILTI
jgi:hypothetical protein